MPPLIPPFAEPLWTKHPLALRSLLPSLQKHAPRLPLPASAVLPTRTTPLPRSLASLFRRQTTTVTASGNPIIPATYSGLNAGPTPGTVVGIVFGSVAGFLLLLWLIYTCFGLGGGNQSSAVVEEEIIRRRSRSPRRSSPRRSSPRRPPSSHSRSVSEVIEIESRRERSPPRSPPRRQRETVIIEETRRAPSRQREDDIVEVIEEHSPARRSSSRRSKVQSGYRTVDPEAFAGGSRPVRKVSRR